MLSRITFLLSCQNVRPPSFQSDLGLFSALDFEDGIGSGGICATHSINSAARFRQLACENPVSNAAWPTRAQRKDRVGRSSQMAHIQFATEMISFLRQLFLHVFL